MCTSSIGRFGEMGRRKGTSACTSFTPAKAIKAMDTTAKHRRLQLDKKCFIRSQNVLNTYFFSNTRQKYGKFRLPAFHDVT